MADDNNLETYSCATSLSLTIFPELASMMLQDETCKKQGPNHYKINLLDSFIL